MQPGSTFKVTLERGADGTYLAWVDELPGCALRAPSRDEALERLPTAISGFLAWTGAAPAGKVRVEVVDEVESAIETDEDTEVLVAADRRALTKEEWARLEHWLAKSRGELGQLLDGLGDEELAHTRAGSERSVREEIEHVAFVELMYALWTFDRHSRDGLAAMLAWTRDAASRRMRDLAEAGESDLTWAEWAGAPRPEPWTARKAARRLVWHELLHLRALERFLREDEPG